MNVWFAVGIAVMLVLLVFEAGYQTGWRKALDDAASAFRKLTMAPEVRDAMHDAIDGLRK